jgi:hypothetical protein
MGVSLSKSISANATKALTKNMNKLFRRVLPLWIQLHFVLVVWGEKTLFWFNKKNNKKG